MPEDRCVPSGDKHRGARAAKQASQMIVGMALFYCPGRAAVAGKQDRPGLSRDKTLAAVNVCHSG